MASGHKSDLWDYYDSGSDDEQPPESDSEDQAQDGANRRQRRTQEPTSNFGLEALLPPAKRQKLQKFFKGKRDIESDPEIPKNPIENSGEINLVDSDTELLEEAAAARQKNSVKTGAPGKRAPVSDDAWENNQLVARMKARLQAETATTPEKANEDNASESEDAEDPSPVQLRRGIRGAAPASSSPQKQGTLNQASPAGTAVRKPSVILGDKAGHVLEARIRSTDKLEKLFQAFISTALESGWTTEGTTFKFVFDGDEVQPTATADDMDLEDKDKIDVYYITQP